MDKRVIFQVVVEDENEGRALKATIQGAIDTENMKPSVQIQRLTEKALVETHPEPYPPSYDEFCYSATEQDGGWMFAGGLFVTATDDKNGARFSMGSEIVFGLIQDVQAVLYHRLYLPRIVKVQDPEAFVRQEIIRLDATDEEERVVMAYELMGAIPEFAEIMDVDDLSSSEMIDLIKEGI